ncbi:MAG TPA: hypothetical protein VGB77_01010 [Abditibacteriaceae bacterium]|jgi:hypothetical protein
MTTETFWMLAMLGMFGLFLRGLQVEARRSLQAIAHDEDDHSWRAEMQLVMAQRQARQRLTAMRAAEEKAATAHRIKAEREAFRAAQLRRSRWEYAAPQNGHDDFDLSGEAFGDHGFARIAEIIDEDELYVPLRSFDERVGRLSEKTDVSSTFEGEISSHKSRLPELQAV